FQVIRLQSRVFPLMCLQSSIIVISFNQKKLLTKSETPSSNPYNVLVLPVAAMAGIISKGFVLPRNFLMTSIAFMMLKNASTDHIGKTPVKIYVAVNK